MTHKEIVRLIRQKELAAAYAAGVPERRSFNPSPARGNLTHEDYDFMEALGRFVDDYRKAKGAIA